jgi:hypothetical protein
MLQKRLKKSAKTSIEAEKETSPENEDGNSKSANMETSILPASQSCVGTKLVDYTVDNMSLWFEDDMTLIHSENALQFPAPQSSRL